MATTTAVLDPIASHRTRSAVLKGAAIALLLLFLSVRTVAIADDYYGIALIPFLPQFHDLGGSDFPAFYGGAELFLSDPSEAYDGDAQARAIAVAKMRPADQTSSWERFYNPPVYSLLLAPLTVFDIHTAFALSLLVNAIGLGLLIGVLHRILRGRTAVFAFAVAGVVTAPVTNYAFWHAQPTLFLAAALGAAYLQRESGRPAWSGLAWAALIVKPHWLALPLLGQLRVSKRQAAAAIAAVAVLSLTFLAVGPQGTIDYIRLLLGRGEVDVGDESFAEAVLSWSGFFRGLTAEARVTSALLMSGLTLVYYLAIRWRGRQELLPLAGAATFVLVVPHSHPQDWIMLVPGMAFLLRSLDRPLELAVTAVLFAGISAGLDNWSNLVDRRYVIYWPTLVGFMLLTWLLILAWLPRTEANAVPGTCRDAVVATP
ncbi:MAG: glycosyltransferase 87 family protein [Dehalococcoidia bacterium]